MVESVSAASSPARRRIIQRQGEEITILVDIDQRGEPVAPAQTPVHRQIGRRPRQPRPRAQIHPPLAAQNALGHGHAFDGERVDAQIAVGPTRIGGAGVDEMRHARQGPPPDRQRANVQPMLPEIERAPVQLDLGHAQEHAMGIAQHHARETRIAIDRPLDPGDFNAQPVVEGDLAQQVGQNAVADRTVQHQYRSGQRRQQGHRQAEEIFEHDPAP
jgi:hypothetical protein